MTHNTDKRFKEKLYNLETPLGSNMSFEQVMAMRNAGKKVLWWKPLLGVVATISALVIVVLAYTGTNKGGENLANTSVSKTNETIILPDNKQSNNQSAQIKKSETGIAAAGRSAEYNRGNAANQSQITSVFNSTTRSNKATVNLEKGITTGELSGTKSKVNDVAPDMPSNPSSVGSSTAWKLSNFGIRIVFEPWDFNFLSFNYKFKHKRHRLPERPKHLPSIELMGMTGSSAKSTFGPSELTVQGNHHFAAYSGLALWDAGKGVHLGAGLGYSEFSGTGDWMRLTSMQQMHIDTTVVTIIQPGLPNKLVTVYDTSYANVNQTKYGSVKYNYSKISIPIGFRMHFGRGTTLLRISGTVAPGVLLKSRGDNFTSTEVKNMDRVAEKAFTLDGRIGVGLYYQLGKRVAALVEPTLQWQSVQAASWKGYSRFGAGLGLGLVVKPW